MPEVSLHLGDCLSILPTIPDTSVDAVVSDPPYPEIDRSYGRMTEAAWHEMMREVVRHTRRILRPKGSAVFILQPNSERVGRMRPWLWEFMAWASREWNQVQDAWWWNFTKSPTVHCQRIRGLMRPSLKACVWLGDPDCFRDQDQVLWTSSEANIAARTAARLLEYQPSGGSMRRARCAQASAERGGVTPFNLLPIANADSRSSAGSHGHGAGTPELLADWWIRYLTRPGDTVADWFSGTATMGVAAVKLGRSYVGIEKMPEYHAIAEHRIAAARTESPLFA